MNTQLNRNEVRLLRHLVLGATILGLLFLVYILLLSARFYDHTEANFSLLLTMHKANPALHFAWFFGAIFPFIAYYFSKRYLSRKKEVDEMLEQKNNIITNNAMFAKSIGEGDYYTSQIEQVDRNDLLTRSLLVMRENLIQGRETEEERAWINEGREQISDVLRNHQELEQLSYETIKTMLAYTDLIQGAFYIYHEDEKKIRRSASYAYNRKKYIKQSFDLGEGLIGACAFERQSIYRNEIPEDFATLTSGILGDKKPGSIFIIPLLSEESLQGIIEVASTEDHIPANVRVLLEEVAPVIGQTLFNLRVNQRTEKLLKESQELTGVLRENEEQLQQNAEEMRSTQEELENTNIELEKQVHEVESSKTKLHSLLENASEVIYIFNKKGEIQYASPSSKAILGYSTEDLLGLKGLDIAEEEFHITISENFQKLLDNPYRTVRYTFKHLTKSGESIWVETSGRNMLDNGAIKGIIFNTRDITLQRLAERERRLKGQMQSLSENSPDMIIRFSQDARFLYANPTCLRYLGLSGQSLNGTVLKDALMEEGLQSFFGEIVADIVTDPKQKEKEFDISTDKGLRSLSFNFIPEFNEDGEFESILVVGNDLTEMKAIEREISEKNRKLNDSINYAERIQNAIMPDVEHFQNGFAGLMLINKARDVVSGDFPWHLRKGNVHYAAAVDCTGHGVPGALLSFIGYFLLNEIVKKMVPADPATILDHFDQGVKDTLKQERHGSDTRDGMDIAIIKIDLDNNTLEFAGAHQPMMHFRGEEYTLIKGDRKSIGGIYGHRAKVKEFTCHKMDIQKGDRIFIFSDGLPDQFGKENKEKFQTKRLKEAVLDNQHNSMAELQEDLSQRIIDWKGNYRQIDDILVIGIEI